MRGSTQLNTFYAFLLCTIVYNDYGYLNQLESPQLAVLALVASGFELDKQILILWRSVA
jgi:hypothetical protein